jgi:hypothetical protein
MLDLWEELGVTPVPLVALSWMLDRLINGHGHPLTIVELESNASSLVESFGLSNLHGIGLSWVHQASEVKFVCNV